MEKEITVFNTEKDSKILRIFALIILLILSTVLFECFRAGIYTYYYHVTPKLLGFVNTTQIPIHTSLIIAIVGLFFFVLFFYNFLRLLVKGMVVKLTVENGRIVQYWNGLTKLINNYSLSDIKRITTKEDSAFNESMGMRMHSYRVVFYRKDNPKKYKVLCRYSEKKIVNATAKELRKIVKQTNQL